jgi:hypothetical protein
LNGERSPLKGTFLIFHVILIDQISFATLLEGSKGLISFKEIVIVSKLSFKGSGIFWGVVSLDGLSGEGVIAKTLLVCEVCLRSFEEFLKILLLLLLSLSLK